MLFGSPFRSTHGLELLYVTLISFTVFGETVPPDFPEITDFLDIEGESVTSECDERPSGQR
jgi:hypothetical protein